MSRTTILTPELQAGIIALIASGVRHKDAAEAMGIGYATFKVWLARGEDTHPSKPSEPVYVAFAEAVREATARVKATLQARAIAAARTTEEFLKVLKAFYPDEWSDRMELTVNVRREAEKLAAENPALNVEDIMAEVDSYLSAMK